MLRSGKKSYYFTKIVTSDRVAKDSYITKAH